MPVLKEVISNGISFNIYESFVSVDMNWDNALPCHVCGKAVSYGYIHKTTGVGRLIFFCLPCESLFSELDLIDLWAGREYVHLLKEEPDAANTRLSPAETAPVTDWFGMAKSITQPEDGIKEGT